MGAFDPDGSGAAQPEPVGELRERWWWLAMVCVIAVAIALTIAYLRCYEDASPEDAVLKAFQESLDDYLANEGPGARGPRFEKFMLRLRDRLSRDDSISGAQLLGLTGPADSTYAKGDQQWHLFFYSMDGKKWMALVPIERGMVKGVSFSATPVGPAAGV